MHLLRFASLLLALLCGLPALSGSADDLRFRIMAGDIAEVEAALNAAVAQDQTPGTDPKAQRDLFAVFAVTHPSVDAFTAKWLSVNPTSANAMTARGWYLHAMGFANRGEDINRYTFRAGYDLMQAQHSEAFSLFTAASSANPNLLAASDGLMVLARTVASDSIIPVELERVMGHQPNRESLMRAMVALAPQWGGSFWQVRLLCARYAPMIKTIADYDAKTCATDAVFFAGFRDGATRDAAHAALALNPHPVLDYARLISAVDGAGPPELRLDVLEKVKSERILTPEETLAWIEARNAVKGLSSNDVDPAYKLAVSQGLDDLRLAADRNPFRANTVLAYIEQLEKNLWENNIAYDVTDATDRVQALLRAVPHNWRAWDRLGKLKSNYANGNPEAITPYFRNAVFYSNYGLDALRGAVNSTLPLIDRKSKRKATSGSLNLTAEDVTDLDRSANCPMVALQRIATYICIEEGISAKDCLSSGMKYILTDLLEDTRARNACQSEANDPLDTILFGPTPIDF